MNAVVPSSPSKTETSFSLRPMGRVEKALNLLRQAGIPVPAVSTADKPLTRLIEDLTPYGETEVVAITRTLGQADVFNELVRQQTAAADVGERYTAISENFESIREDVKRMVGVAEKGKVTLGSRISDTWMNISRGSVSSRFSRIQNTADGLFRSSEDLIHRQQAILEAYSEFRIGLKEAGILAKNIEGAATKDFETCQNTLAATQEALSQAAEGSNERQTLEIQRDEAQIALRQAERRFQLATDLAQNLTISYNVGEVVMSRLAQTSSAHEQVWRKAVSFIQTNESVFTALSATLTSILGLNETTKGHNALLKGTNDALNDLGTVGTSVQKDALRAGYGKTIDANAVKTLVDSIVSYQTESAELIREMRKEAKENTQAIASIVEEGKRRLVALTVEGGQPA